MKRSETKILDNMRTMSIKGLELLLARFRKYRRVFVYWFNIECFTRYIEVRGVRFDVESMEFDENGDYVGQYFVID